MRTYGAFEELPLHTITPEGWLRRYLERQREGLTGHMEQAGYPYDTKGWGQRRHVGGGDETWWPYEQTGYWVDGAIRCAHLLNDADLLRKASQPIDFVLKHAARDGFLGPAFLREAEHWNRWAHAVFFRALMAQHSATGDKRIAQAVRKHYVGHDYLHNDGREVCNVESMLWAYRLTGDKRLLKMARDAFARYGHSSWVTNDDTTLEVMLSPKRACEHGVTYCEIGKLGAILYLHTGDKRLLQASVNAYHKMARDQMLIDGAPSSTEHLRGKDPLDSHETCDIADYTWGAGYLLMATGMAEYADRIERACFNAAPGAVTEDFRGLQYFSCPNQVIADRTSNHNLFFRGRQWMSYRPNPGTECCPGEVNRIMPNYASRMWLSDGAGGVVASLYGPSRVTLRLGSPAREVTIVQETDYPFGERIDLQVRCDHPVRFALHLRIPGWCRKAELLINGQRNRGKLKAGTFVSLDRTFEPNDRITLRLPMEVKLSRWPRGGVGLERGPLVFALPIAEHRTRDRGEKRSSREFPAWNMEPASDWNYALALDGRKLAQQVEVIHQPPTPEPWSPAAAPVMLRVPARKVKGWDLVETTSFLAQFGATNEPVTVTTDKPIRLTPQVPEPKTLARRLAKQTEMITLVPYGCTQLRLTIFPQAK